MTGRTWVWGFLLADLVVSMVGNYFTKRWADGGGVPMAAAGIVFYSVAMACWFLTMRAGEGALARMGTLCDLVNCVGVLGMGVLVFNETVTVRQGIGFVLAIAAVVLLG